MTLPSQFADFESFSVQALQLFQEYEWAYNFKAIEILFPENISRIPEEVKRYFQGVAEEDNFQGILQPEFQDKDLSIRFPVSLKSFMPTCINLTVDEAEEMVGEDQLPHVEAKRNWPHKKLEEVQHMAKFVGTRSQELQCDLIIDVGSGLGYLASGIAENYGIDVLAIESKAERLVSSENKMIQSPHNLSHLNMELTADASIQIQPFTDSYKNVCLTGLHACGDLIPWTLNLFLNDPKYQLLAMVPCCYHKMKFGSDSDSDMINFPMSQTLKNVLKTYPSPSFIQNVHLCRLAGQRDGIDVLKDIALEANRLFHRSVLALYAHSENLSLVKKKRRIRSCPKRFEEYIDLAIGPNGGFSLQGSFEANKEGLQKLYTENLHWLSSITGIMAMQRTMRPIAENLILLDRLEFLFESGKVDRALVQVIIPKSVTPRGIVILATKNSTADRIRMRILQNVFIILSRRVHTKTLKNLETLNIQSKSKAQTTLHDLLINMPKEQPHIPILKSARAKKKDLMAKFPAGYITLQILGNGTKGAPASLYMFTDQSRYLFNCGEGSQRLAHEHKMKLAKLEHVFLTSTSWDRIGGLPGLALTIQDIGVPSIALHGPPGLEQLFEGTRRFVILKDLQIHVTDCVSKDKFHEDHIMRVDYIPLFKAEPEVTDESIDVKSSSSDTSLGEDEDHTDYYAPMKGFKRHLEITKEESVGPPDVKKGKVDDLLPQKGEPRVECVICYVCKPKEKAGALMISKCLELGVPSGPLLGKLKSGLDVTLKDGRVVKAEDVRSPDLRSPVFIIVDCPNESYLEALVQSPEFVQYQDSEQSEEDSTHIIVHFSPKSIMENPKYIQWMNKFRISTRHILINDICSGMGSEAVHRVQHKLNLIDENMFPLLKGESIEIETSETEFRNDVKLQLIMGKTLLKYNLRPNSGLDDSSVIILNPEDYIKESIETENFPEELKELKARFASMNSSGAEYPKIVFLGTGSCIPNKTRNTSGMLLHVNENTNMILDCGEGTFGQLVRFFGPEEVDQVLIKTKAIYISHLHADHHLGLINILRSRQLAFTRQNLPFNPVFLIAPHQIQSWLYLYHKHFEKLKHLYSLVATTSLIYNNSSLESEFAKTFYEALNMKLIETIGVRHCPNAYGVAVTGKEGWKITYSGDTMPCDFLVTLGLNSDLLIHEATMEDELKHEAELKMHSTTSEAIAIGKKMNAKFILLTHFSQRYSKVPKISGDLEQNVGIAFDNMRVSLRDLPKLPMMYPTLKTLFAESYEEMENKTTKKLLRIERDKQRLTQSQS